MPKKNIEDFWNNEKRLLSTVVPQQTQEKNVYYFIYNCLMAMLFTKCLYGVAQ